MGAAGEAVAGKWQPCGAACHYYCMSEAGIRWQSIHRKQQCCHSWPYAAAVAVFRLLRPKVCGHLTATFFFQNGKISQC
jgi:hypothetical protein